MEVTFVFLILIFCAWRVQVWNETNFKSFILKIGVIAHYIVLPGAEGFLKGWLDGIV